jgi:hypothetical protein
VRNIEMAREMEMGREYGDRDIKVAKACDIRLQVLYKVEA